MQNVNLTILPFVKTSKLLKKLILIQSTVDVKCDFYGKLIIKTYTYPHLTIKMKTYLLQIWESESWKYTLWTCPNVCTYSRPSAELILCKTVQLPSSTLWIYSKYKVALQPAPSAQLTRRQMAGFCTSRTTFQGSSTGSDTLTGRQGQKPQLETNAFSTYLAQGLLSHKDPKQHSSFTESWI